MGASMKDITVVGAGGRMGQNIMKVLWQEGGMDIAGALEKADHHAIGRDIGELLGIGRIGISITSNVNTALENSDGIIDFSSPESLYLYKDLAIQKRIPVVIGTTGYTDKEYAVLEEMSKHIAVLISPNMSLGVNLLFYLVEEAAKHLKDYDVEIMEIHHKRKKDAPSGTALKLAEIIKNVKGLNIITERHGRDALRKKNELGVFALRGGDVVGDHDVFFLGDGERIVLSHKAHSRMTFAKGAVFAIDELLEKPPGLYSMKDILGL